MHCDEARQRLFDRLDDPGGARAEDAELGRHLDGCEDCRRLRDDVAAMSTRVQVWHELQPPAWNPAGPVRPARHPGRSWAALVSQWFPVLASTAALVLAAGVYWRDGRAGPPPAGPPSAGAANAAFAVPGDAASLLAAARQERRQDLQTLTGLLRAEMDRRSLETEQSLKYLIAQQIESQRQLDSVRGKLEQVRARGAGQL